MDSISPPKKSGVLCSDENGHPPGESNGSVGQNPIEPQSSSSNAIVGKSQLKKKRVGAKGVHKVITASGRVVWAEKGFNPDKLSRTDYPFSEVIADQVCQKVTEGFTVKDISKLEGFPPIGVIWRWTRIHPEFHKALSLAYRDQGHYHVDRVHELTEEISTKREADINTAKIKGHQWLAEKRNPQEFGKRNIIEGNPDKPVMIRVHTGINRPAIEVESSQALEEESEEDDQGA